MATVVAIVSTCIAAFAIYKWINMTLKFITVFYYVEKKLLVEPSEQDLEDCFRALIREFVFDLFKRGS